MNANAKAMNNKDEEIFDRGTPWDYIQDMARLLDKLVASHNKLAEQHNVLEKKHGNLVKAHRELLRDLRNGEYTK